MTLIEQTITLDFEVSAEKHTDPLDGSSYFENFKVDFAGADNIELTRRQRSTLAWLIRLVINEDLNSINWD